MFSLSQSFGLKEIFAFLGDSTESLRFLEDCLFMKSGRKLTVGQFVLQQGGRSQVEEEVLHAEVCSCTKTSQLHLGVNVQGPYHVDVDDKTGL